jgi:hypothetical protein
MIGDGLCYLIGRHIGLDRWRWQREGRVAAAIARVRDTVAPQCSCSPHGTSPSRGSR